MQEEKMKKKREKKQSGENNQLKVIEMCLYMFTLWIVEIVELFNQFYSDQQQ